MQHTINKYPDALRKYSNTEIKSSKWGARVRNKNAMNLIGVEEVIINIDRILKL